MSADDPAAEGLPITPDTTVEEVADRLYAVPPEEFVAVRTASVKAARSAGQRELARRIGALRKPTKSAWVVNLLARDAADDLQELLDLGAALAEATRALSGSDLRRLSTQRNAAVEGLTRRAAGLAADHDHTLSEGQRTEISQTLQAALADPNVAHVVRSGVLTQPTQYGGFGPLDVIGAVEPGRLPSPTGSTGRRSATGQQSSTDGDGDAARQAARAAAEARVREATATSAAAVEAADRAAAEAESATERADELIMQVAQLKSRLSEMEAEAEAARTAVAAAVDERDRTRRAAEDAARTVASAEAELRDLT